MATYYLAIDIGASSGRHILGTMIDGKIHYEEIYRFYNGLNEKNQHLCWDSDYLLQQIIAGMKKCKEIGKIPVSLGIDTWGVDFILIDQQGNQIGDFVSYRDSRTDGMQKRVHSYIEEEEELYKRTGIQSQNYNTIYQLMAINETEPELLNQADAMLMTPDYFNYRLTGEKRQEYTMASTTQLLQIHSGEWDFELIEKLSLPRHIFQRIERPGSFVGNLTEVIQREVGFDCNVIMSASHDTASAVVSVPCLDEKMLYISSGTWSLMGVETDEAISTLACKAAGLSNEGGFASKYTVLKNIMGLWMIQSVKKEIGEEFTFGEICEMASKETINSIVDCNDDSFLAPVSMVEAIRTFCKNTNQEIPETLAAISSVIYNSLAQCYAKTKEEIEILTKTNYDRIYIIGGGSQADYLNRLTCRFANCEVYAGPAEATAIGNILIQMVANDTIKDLQDARRYVMDSFKPKLYK